MRRRDYGVLAALIALLSLFTYVFEGPREMNDLEVFYRAAERAQLHRPLYLESDGHFQFKYLPAAAFLFRPLTLVPLEAAKVLWVLVMAGAIFSLFLWSYERLPGPKPRPLFLLIPVLLILGRSFERELANGQVNVVVAALLLLACTLLRRSEWAAGLFVGVTCAVKPNGVLLFPFLLLVGHWRAAVFASLALFLAVELPALAYGFEGNHALLVEMRASLGKSTARFLYESAEGSGPIYARAANISLLGTTTKWFGAGHALAAGILALLVGSALAIYFVWHVRRSPSKDRTFEYAYALALLPLFSPQAWDYTIVAATPVFVELVGRFRRLGMRLKVLASISFVVLALDYRTLLGAARYPGFMRWSLPAVAYLCVLVLALRSRVTAAERPETCGSR